MNLSERTRIVSKGDRGLVDESPFVALDGEGNIWAGRGRSIDVYSPSGDFLDSFGRDGAGAGEFRYTGPMYTDRDGNVHIFDSMLGRETVADSRRKLKFVRSVPAGVNKVVSAANVSFVFVNTVHSDSTGIAYLVHELGANGIVRSFSRAPAGGSSATLERNIAVSKSGRVYVGERYAPSIDIYHEQGKLLNRITLPVAWVPPRNGDPRNMPNSELAGLVQDMVVDTSGVLKIIVWEPKDDWKSNATTFTGPGGETMYREKDYTVSWYRTSVLLYDAKANRVLDRKYSNISLWGFIDAESAFGYAYDKSGQPELVVFEVKY
ncbi:NHL repeat-containing protein [Gemmatimonas sp.]